MSAFMKVFTIDPGSPMAIRAMVKAVRDGRRLAIFPEGRISLTGALMKIYDGPGMIADRADASIIPTYRPTPQRSWMLLRRGVFPFNATTIINLT